jgi:hypothetical protein
MSRIFLVLLCIVSSQLHAQYFTVKQLKGKTASVKFPLFERTGDSLATERINTLLFLSELEILPAANMKDISAQVGEGNIGLYGDKTDLSYEIIENNSKLLSISFDEAASGMTTHYWTSYYVFNAQNGSRVDLGDLLTKQGVLGLHALLKRKGAANLKVQLAAIRKNKEQYPDTASIEEINGCFASDMFYGFYIQNGQLIIDQSNCLSKNTALFSGIDMKVTITFKELAPYLTDYGKALFDPQVTDVAAYVSHTMPQLMKGSIGSFPIVFLLRKDYDNTYSGIYAYEKKKVGINLDGEKSGSEIILKERNKNLDETGTFKATLSKNELKGTWTSENGKHRYPFSARQY